jgi:hypothetical protein
MRSGLAASGKALKQVAEQHVFFIDAIGHRQLAHSRSRPVGPKSLDHPVRMRGRECETNEGAFRRREEGVELVQLRWGFPPPRPKGAPVINFRSEGRRFPKGRCLIPASHFFEFTGTKSPKSAGSLAVEQVR